MSDIELTTMTAGAEAEAASVIARAMLTNPNHVAIWKGRGDTQLARQSALIGMVLAKTPPQDVFVATSDSELVGVLRMVPSQACQLSPAQGMALLPRIVATQRGCTGRVLGWLSTWAKHDPDEVHWHLGPVGVLPDRQGQHVGSQLMNRFIERVDADGVGAYLETDKEQNVGFYERFGFETTGTVEVSGVTNWLMWRGPRSG